MSKNFFGELVKSTTFLNEIEFCTNPEFQGSFFYWWTGSNDMQRNLDMLYTGLLSHFQSRCKIT